MPKKLKDIVINSLMMHLVEIPMRIGILINIYTIKPETSCIYLGTNILVFKSVIKEYQIR